MKNCYVCKTDKTSDEFGKNRRYADGLQRICKLCWTARSAIYRAQNIDAVRAIERTSKKKHWDADPMIRENNRRYKKKNRSQLRDYERERYRRDPEYYRTAMRRWRANNPEACYVQDVKKRTRRSQAKGTATEKQVRDRMAYWGFRCWACAGVMESVDHVIPLSRGGTNWPANLRPCCLSCNSSKGAKHWQRWLAERQVA